MRVAYLDCFAGISGDMFLGALVDAGVPLSVLEEATRALAVGASLRVTKVDRSGITATKVDVMEGDRLAEEAGPDEQVTRSHQHQQQTQHLHKGGHDHAHPEHVGSLPSERVAPAHSHAHGRSLTAIRELIGGAALGEAVKARALRTFTLLGESEAKIHNVPVDAIHFHEVGAVDAIVDIVAASAGIEAMQEAAVRETGVPLAWWCSALNVGGGMVQCAHGTFPVPAPATADLLRGMPTYGAHVQQELVTPTGAAIVRALAPTFGQQPAMQVDRIGYGAGGRNPDGFPNVLRLLQGEAAETSRGADLGERVTVLETALDDCSPQVVAHVMERALRLGALDVMTTAVGMKKGRQGQMLTILCEESLAATMEALLLRETTTLGVRRRSETRSTLERTHTRVETAYGAVRIKVGRRAGEVLNVQPEFDDCRAAAERHGVPIKRVMEAAIVRLSADGSEQS